MIRPPSTAPWPPSARRSEQRQAVTVTVGPHPDDPEARVILGDAPGDEEHPSPFLTRDHSPG
jgi:hypothetical protein